MGTKVTILAECSDDKVIHVSVAGPTAGGWTNLQSGSTHTVELGPNDRLAIHEMRRPPRMAAEG